MLGTRLPQQIFCITYRRCIKRTNFLKCIQMVHRPHTISLQASNPVSTHEFLPSSWGAGCCGMWATGDLSPIRQQHGKHHSSDDNETTCSSESVSHSLREDDSHSETSSDSTERQQPLRERQLALQPVFRRSVGISRDWTRISTIKVEKAQTAYSRFQFRSL